MLLSLPPSRIVLVIGMKSQTIHPKGPANKLPPSTHPLRRAPHVLHLLPRPIRLRPPSLRPPTTLLHPKTIPRMKHIQRHHRERNHRPLKPNKQPLRLDDLPSPPVRHLHNPVNAPNKHTHSRHPQRHQKQPKPRPRAHVRIRWIQYRFPCRLAVGFHPVPPHYVEGKPHEDEQRTHLDRDAREEDVVARRGVFVCDAGGVGDATACSLYAQGEDVEGDEDAGVGAGFEIGNSLAAHSDAGNGRGG